MTNHAEHYAEKVEGRHYTGAPLVDPELDDWVPVANMQGKNKILNDNLECNPKRGLVRYTITKIVCNITKQHGYAFINVILNGARYGAKLHIVICTTVYGYRPLGLYEVNHKDFDRMNSCANNLEWCDGKYNNWYNRKKPKKYYVYAIDTLKKVKEFDCLLSLLEYYKVDYICTTTIEGLRNAKKPIATLFGVYITIPDYGEILDLPNTCVRDQGKKPLSAHNKTTGVTLVFKTMADCIKHFGIPKSVMYKQRRNSNDILEFKDYKLRFLSYEEYHILYAMSLNTNSIMFYDATFSKRKKVYTSDSMYDYIYRRIQGLGTAILDISAHKLPKDLCKELVVYRDTIDRIIKENETITEETPQCTTTQTPLSLCA